MKARRGSCERRPEGTLSKSTGDILGDKGTFRNDLELHSNILNSRNKSRKNAANVGILLLLRIVKYRYYTLVGSVPNIDTKI